MPDKLVDDVTATAYAEAIEQFKDIKYMSEKDAKCITEFIVGRLRMHMTDHKIRWLLLNTDPGSKYVRANYDCIR